MASSLRCADSLTSYSLAPNCLISLSTCSAQPLRPGPYASYSSWINAGIVVGSPKSANVRNAAHRTLLLSS